MDEKTMIKKLEYQYKISSTISTIIFIIAFIIMIGLEIWANTPETTKPKFKNDSISFSRGTGCDYSKYQSSDDQTIAEKGKIKFENSDYAIYEYQGKEYKILK